MPGKQASTKSVPSKLGHVVIVFIVHFTSFPKYVFFLVPLASLGDGFKEKHCMKGSIIVMHSFWEEYLLKSSVTQCTIKKRKLKMKTLRNMCLAF